MSDPRFARFKTDPRFRRIKKDQSKVIVDDRFKGVFEGEKKNKGKKTKGAQTRPEQHLTLTYIELVWDSRPC